MKLQDELAAIVNAVSIHSPAAFTFAGRPSSGLAMPVLGLQLSPEMPPLMNELTMQLYQHCFANRFTGQIPPADPPHPSPDPAWVDTLALANQSRERWEDGWQIVYSMPNGHVAAKRGSTLRTLAPGEFVNLGGGGMALPPGTELRVFVPRDSRTVQPGYYFAFGETLPDSADEMSVVRFYWHVAAGGAAGLLGSISSDFNRWQLPYRFKTPVHAMMFGRTDSAVLYVPRRYAAFAFDLITDIYRRMRPHLAAEVPLFTLRIAPGLAFAEDPGTQESFGMCRSRILAQGLWLAHTKRAQTALDRLKIVLRNFESEGISLERPWLNRGSAGDCAFALEEAEAA